MSASIPPSDVPNRGEGEAANQERAAAALQAAFARLAPQGSDAWNFLAAFTHLGDRYGPYQPGASALSDLLARDEQAAGAKGRRRRSRSHRSAAADDAPTDLDAAMAQVVEAFRFLSARVQTLEARLAREDHPLDGAAWLIPAVEMGALVAPVAAHVSRVSPGGTVVHADCGRGDLLVALSGAGVEAEGVEPRGAVALDALERGCTVTICEVGEDLAGRADTSLGGLVLGGVIDRLPVHAVVHVLTQARRVLALGAPLVMIVTDPVGAERWDASSRDLVDARPLSAQTWAVLLERAGFVGIAPLDAEHEGTRRSIITASTPS